jgi:tetratricopeptide (TPR) repeat protein
MKKVLLALMITCCFTLATALEPYFQELEKSASGSASLLVALFGDSRRLFANHFFAKADAYFHGGFYPGIFDQPMREDHSHLTQEGNEREEKEDKGGHHDEDNFLGAPRDIIDKFGRNFYFTQHRHLSGGNEREMLPWIRLAADLDPQSPDTYITGGYWLRRLKRPQEAEAFLREGLYANPDSYEILLALGRLYFEDKHEPKTARNLFHLALGKWNAQQARGDKPDAVICGEIYGELVRLDEAEGDKVQQLADLENLQNFSPDREGMAKTIAALKAELEKNPPPSPAPK